MKLGCNYYRCDLELLAINLSNYRRSFLKRKNINSYVCLKKGTPIIIDKLINSFDRKIKGIPIFTEDVKKEYFEGLKNVFNSFYEDLNTPRLSRKYAHGNYIATHFKTTGKGRSKKNNISELLAFKEFVRCGLSNNYR